MVCISCDCADTHKPPTHSHIMKTLDRISGAIMCTIALGVLIGLPVFSCIRDAKGLKSSAPICAPEEALEECLEPLPPIV
jgi:hypothetical protein